MPNNGTPGRSTAFGHLQDDLHLTDRALDQVRFHLQAEQPSLAAGALAEARLHWQAGADAARQVTPGERDEADEAVSASLRNIEAWADKIDLPSPSAE